MIGTERTGKMSRDAKDAVLLIAMGLIAVLIFCGGVIALFSWTPLIPLTFVRRDLTWSGLGSI